MLELIKSLFKKKAPIEMVHPEHGVLTFEGELWSGCVERAGRKIEIAVAGTEAGPDAVLMRRLGELLGRFETIEQRAREYVQEIEPRIRQEELRFCGLDLLWEDRPEWFVVDFTLKGDVDGLWRVEFENEEPKSLGRDD
jgi:hypothetical protein